MKTFADFGIDIQGFTPNSEGQIKRTCPQCSHKRTNKTDFCLSVNVKKGVWFCHYCSFRGGLSYGCNKKEEKQYIRPEWTKIYEARIEEKEPDLITWFANRGIPESVIKRNNICTGTAFFQKPNKELPCIQFPYCESDGLVNIKYRALEDKHFALHKGAELILYGIDDIDINKDLIIVEGEIDKLSVEVAGYTNCVSVPNGSQDGKLDFFEHPIIEQIKRFIIAVDDDPKGHRLRDALIAKFGIDKCLIVNWGDVGCKDANEVLVLENKENLAWMLNNPKIAPCEGIFNISDFNSAIDSILENGFKKGCGTGWYSVDRKYSIRKGEFTIITGIPGSGKSEFLDALCVNLAIKYDYRIAMYSPENFIDEHVSRLIEKVARKPIIKEYSTNEYPRITKEEGEKAKNIIISHFQVIEPKDSSIDELLRCASYSKMTFGIDILTLDPWNYIEHKRDKNMNETEYVSQVLSKIKDFAKQRDVHVFLVAHPKQQTKKADGTFPVITGYDISGSANFYNKCDCMIWVERKDQSGDKLLTILHFIKIKSKAIGECGDVALRYIKEIGCYEDEVSTIPDDFKSKTRTEKNGNEQEKHKFNFYTE